MPAAKGDVVIVIRQSLKSLLVLLTIGTGFLLFGLELSRSQDSANEAAPDESTSGLRGSIIEDRTASKLIEAGDSRMDANEADKAVEIWESVLERYPRSRYRFVAHMRLGDYYLQRDRSYDKARLHFEAAASEENSDEEQRAEATLRLGVAHFESRNHGKCFQAMRDVIEKFPVSPQVNHAYYYIGLAHFQLGHYSRAIAALEKVGTNVSEEDGMTPKVEAGKRFFVKIEDADLAVLESNQAIDVKCTTKSGDSELVKCYPVGRNVRIALGSIPTALGKTVQGNGRLEVIGNDEVHITYIDSHTADRTFDRPVDKQIMIVSNAMVQVMDGAFNEALQGVVLDKSMNLQIIDLDRDLGDDADTLTAIVEVFRVKTEEELENEAIALQQQAATQPPVEKAEDDIDIPGDEEEVDRLKRVDRLEVTLTEAKIKVTSSPTLPSPDDDDESRSAAQSEDEKSKTESRKTADDKKAEKVKKEDVGDQPSPASDEPESPLNASAEPVDDGSVHSGVFRGNVQLTKADEVVENDDQLQARPGDLVRISYIDDRNLSPDSQIVLGEVRCIEGNLGGVRVTRAMISNEELRVRTKLKTADALMNIGNRYKEFGLGENATRKYENALQVCEEIMQEATQTGGALLEETYVQLWQIYFAMDQLDLAAVMASRLQREFPQSGFVDDALLQLADVARKQKNYNRAIGIYTRLVNMQTSQLRGDAQFGIAECYDEMAAVASELQGNQLYDRAFQEYKKVFDQYPESGRVGEAVAKMANYYYRQKDYTRAIDTFETVLASHPDAKFLDVILFNYGRCLYRMNRRDDARRRFDQLISDYPESPLAVDAKKISEALAKASN
ncbi:MAG: tetratricopeptide repeat protein [Planctomycetota bacterium]|nr:tetratricopeptide repeat protein [Planctomycetota bacterium]MDA1211848.1 tetratricopeptide repeat protein [Planctomycetota bacterium]